MTLGLRQADHISSAGDRVRGPGFATALSVHRAVVARRLGHTSRPLTWTVPFGFRSDTGEHA